MIDVMVAEQVNSFRLATGIAIVDRKAGQILQIGDGGQYRWEPIGPGEVITSSFCLPADAARALLDELTRHFHGADDARALRKDYEHERTRVDTLIGTLCDLVRARAT